MRKLLTILAITVIATVNAHSTELHDKLLKIKGVTSVEQIDKGLFSERYVVMMEQPLDHKNPKKGKFEQRIIVAHSNFNRPTMLITEGYGAARALNNIYREEISRKLNTNQISVEHRYFGTSTPSPCNWTYMTGENAAADLHAVRTALASIYPRKWVASGISKGGQNTIIYAYFYPNDVDAYVPYVAPICFGIEDGRHEPFLERVGTVSERTAILELQKLMLARRAELVPMFAEYCQDKEYKFRIPTEEVFDYCVLEYPFSLWQWGTSVSTIPTSEATNKELLDHLITLVEPKYFSISDEPSFYVQAARELGYYGYNTKPFEGLLAVKDTKGYLRKLFLPKDAQKIKFSDDLALKLTHYLTANDPKMIFIYGEIDPWSAVMPSANIFQGKTNMKLIIEKGGSHKARIDNLPQEIADDVWAKLASWLK